MIGGVMYVSTPASPYKADLVSTVSAVEPETGKVLWQYKSPRHIHGRPARSPDRPLVRVRHVAHARFWRRRTRIA